jgi:hypothetical protein
VSQGAVPLRLSADRIVLYGIVLAVVASLPFIVFPGWFHDVAFRGDFANFWSAGANAGTRALLDPRAIALWQRAHEITPQIFVYPPGFAWFYAPLARLSPMAAMMSADACMIAIVAAAALLAARVYGFSKWFALLATFAWGPILNALELGQNTGLALLLMLAASWALIRRREFVAGLAIGLLLYKPSVALPFVVLLAARAQWRALAVVAASAAAWYLISVLATHGDWSWPGTYVRLVAASNGGEFAGNAHKAYTIPTLLLAAGAPLGLAYSVAAAVLIAAIPLLARVSALQAASMTPLVGLATSIHAWPYEAALLLPAVCYATVRIPEPLRTQVVGAAYLVATLALVVPYAGHALALLCIGGTAWWLWSGYHGATAARSHSAALLETNS